MQPDRPQRFDIQVLRGIAVLAVVAFHAAPDYVPAGYLGVDVFFVISGYLVTSLILRDIDRGSFSFSGFYVRRARRLLPAALCTLAVTSLAALGTLTAAQIQDYAHQLVGSLTFTANLFLSDQGGYFDSAAEGRPLLHMWSLSLEEQFYLIIPLLLVSVSARWRLNSLLLLAYLSLLACLIAVSVEPWRSDAFYLLPTRAWELLVGSICAALTLKRQRAIPRMVQWVCLIVIVAAGVSGFDPVHPRGDALIVVIATALLVCGRDEWLPNASLQPIAKIGDWSYSLYLVHWPLLSFAWLLYLGDPPKIVIAALVIVAFPLAWLQYRFVEEVFRHPRPLKRRTVAAAAFTTAVLVTACSPVVHSAEVPRSPPVRGLAPECAQGSPHWQDLKRCRTSSAPTLALWGDSNAMHLAPGLAAAHPLIVQLTMSACAPILDLSRIDRSYPVSWARKCASFQRSAFDHIISTPSIRFVVIASSFEPVFNNYGQKLLIRGKVSPWSGVGEEYFRKTIMRVQAAGKIPIIVAPIPRAAFDPGQCGIRLREGKLILGRSDCAIQREELLRWYKNVLVALRRVSAQTGAPLVLPEGVLCSQERCETIGGKPMYRDAGHLSSYGSKVVGEAIGEAVQQFDAEVGRSVG